MRTVDPELWCSKLKKPSIQVTRRMKFGQQPAHKLETRLRESLQDAAAEFWRDCSLSAAKYMNIDYTIRYERYRHIALLTMTLLLGILLFVYNYSAFHERPPLIISPDFTDNSVTKFRFPAVALCSNNVISKVALKNLTNFLYSHPQNTVYGYPRSEIENNLLSLGSLLTFTLPPLKIRFEKFLLDIQPLFNITDIMFKLSANCSTMLQRCSWRGRLVDCESLFATRLTPLGFCCVFNSRYQPGDYDREPAVLDLLGQDHGLGVVVKEERDDFAFVRRPAFGFEMLLFAGDEYPLLESGDVRMYPIPRNASLFCNIRTFTQYPADDILYYGEEWRGCRMEGGGLSWCLTECRRETAQALCGCVPYALQPQFVPPKVPTCTLSELSCLNKHREKFLYLYPGEDADEALSQELEDALDCWYCRVLCKRQLYSADISYAYYINKKRLLRNFLRKMIQSLTFGSEGLSLVNTTVIRLFYSTNHQKQYKLEAYTRWYEVTVKLCTHWIVVTGVSFLCYSELLYHCTFRWVHHFMRRTRIARLEPVTTSM